MIETIIKHALSTIPASAESICMDDVYHYFCDAKEWIRAAAFKRTESECLLELKATVAPSILSIYDLQSLQYKIWHALAFAHFEASSITLYREASVMRFITSSGSKSCFTGRMIIGGDHYYQLLGRRLPKLPAAPFAIDFSDLDEHLLSLSEAQASSKIEREEDHQRRLAVAIKTVQVVNQYTSAGKQEVLNSTQLKDALMFNLQQLYRHCFYFEMRGYVGVKEWRERLRATSGFMQNPESVDAAVVWSLSVSEAPEYLRLITSSPEQLPGQTEIEK